MLFLYLKSCIPYIIVSLITPRIIHQTIFLYLYWYYFVSVSFISNEDVPNSRFLLLSLIVCSSQFGSFSGDPLAVLMGCSQTGRIIVSTRVLVRTCLGLSPFVPTFLSFTFLTNLLVFLFLLLPLFTRYSCVGTHHVLRSS